jgi:hypothetical protein
MYFSFYSTFTEARRSGACIATGYGFDDRRFGARVTIESRIFTRTYRPDRLWVPLSLLPIGCFRGGEAAETWAHRQIMARLRKLKKTKLNSMVWVRERTIPIERPPLVGEVIANFLRMEGATWSAWRIPTAVYRFSRRGPLLFCQVAPQLYSRGWVDPVPDPLRFFSGSAGNRTRAFGSVARNSDH